MKFETTKKLIKQNYKNVICIGYCETAYLLKGCEEYAYTHGVYGWNADVYKINNNTVIVTGYRPFGDIKPPYELVEKYENKAKKIYKEHCGTWENLKSILNELLNEFVIEALKEE